MVFEMAFAFRVISAIYNWHGDNPYALHLEIGDTVQILEQCYGM